MKKLQLTAMALFMASVSFAQTAPDFTATDCNSASHTLYTDLNAGKVVVISWVMPCGACVGGAVSAYNATQSFATSHPGKVLNYLADDDGGTSCSSLSSWATTNGIDVTKTSVFGNAGTPMNEANYGGSGMPHVIVIGPDKQIKLNLKNSAANNQTAITNAINLALAPASVSEIANDVSAISVYPNPASTSTMLEYALTKSSSITVQLIDVTGKVVADLYKGNAHAGKNSVSIPTSFYSAGNYTIKMTTNEGVSISKLVIAK